jgi:hypothetical protein
MNLLGIVSEIRKYFAISPLKPSRLGDFGGLALPNCSRVRTSNRIEPESG